MPSTTYRYEDIKVENLKLDTLNPRLPKSLHGRSESSIIEYMLLEASTLELMQAIGENGFFAGGQLLVVEDSDSKFLVVEGNRRLTAVKLLLDKSLATVQKSKVEQVFDESEFHPEEVPCLIFENKETILKYLGYRHITGVKSWKLLEKARYLNNLKDTSFPQTTFQEACRELAKMIGSRKDYVQRLVAGFQIYKIIEDNAFYKIRDLDDTTFFFNYIADSLNHANIEKFLGIDLGKENPLETLNLENLREWTFWLFEKNDQNKTRLNGSSGDLVKLNKILANPEANKAFKDKGVELTKAYELTEDVNQIFLDSITKSLSYLEQADDLVHKITSPYSDFSEDLISIRKLTTKIKQATENAEDDEFKENLAAQFKGFSVKAPTIPQHLSYLFADYVELISLFSNDCFVTASDILDRLQDEGILNKKEDEESLEVGSISSDENDRLEIWVNNIFKILEDRAILFASDYPFYYHPTKLLLQKNLAYKQQLYISLLLSSNLNLFDKVRSDLTSEFETISFYALKNYLPRHAIVKQFGKQSDYVGNAKTKIKSLAKDLRVTVDDYELNHISERNNQEKGLDIIGWIPFSDYCGNQVTILGQCACGKEWYSKHHDTKRYVHYLKFYRMNPHHAMFIPYSLINYPDNKFYSSDEVEENTLLFERKRITEYFNDESVFDTLNSKIIVEKCLSYQEDIV